MEWTEDLLYELALSRIDGIGSVNYKALSNHFGSAKTILGLPSSKIQKIQGIGVLVSENLKKRAEALQEADNILKQCSKLNIRVVSIFSETYPVKLKELYDAPPILYVKGKGKIQTNRTLAIVGTRDATDYGKKTTEELVRGLENVQIVSGMAYGIDITAHKAALESQASTIGVLAHGLEMVYPSLHTKIGEEMLENGLLISEHPPETSMHPQHFVARNRIIAGLSEAVVVVESAKRGGGLITAEYANNYNREVFAVPGDVNRKQAQGTNNLIAKHKANIYTNPKDLADWLNWNTESKSKVSKPTLDLSTFTEEERIVLELLSSKGEMLIDDISWQSQIQLNRLSSILLNLEFANVIKQVPGKKFGIS